MTHEVRNKEPRPFCVFDTKQLADVNLDSFAIPKIDVVAKI